jgi:hypothetical protein
MIVPAVCDMARAQGTSHEILCRFHDGRFSNQTTGISRPFIRRLQPTQSMPDVLDLPSQKGNARRS